MDSGDGHSRQAMTLYSFGGSRALRFGSEGLVETKRAQLSGKQRRML